MAATSIPILIRDPEIEGKIEGRAIVLCDTNLWINLARARTDETRRLQARLRELVRRSRLFCPLTFTTIRELLSQCPDSAAQVAALMEELSLNIAFASTEEIFAIEVDAAFDAIRLDHDRRSLRPSEIFVPSFSFLSRQSYLHFPTSKFSLDKQQQLANEITQCVRGAGIRELVRALSSMLPLPREKAPPYQAAALRRREYAAGNKQRAWEVEKEAAARNIVAPRVEHLKQRCRDGRSLDLLGRFCRLAEDGSCVVEDTVLEKMPSVMHYIDVMTVVGWDTRRRNCVNDFFDRELIFAPFVYSDVCVTLDGGLRDVLSQALKLNDIDACVTRCVPTYYALEQYLDGL